MLDRCKRKENLNVAILKRGTWVVNKSDKKDDKGQASDGSWVYDWTRKMEDSPVLFRRICCPSLDSYRLILLITKLMSLVIKAV